VEKPLRHGFAIVIGMELKKVNRRDGLAESFRFYLKAVNFDVRVREARHGGFWHFSDPARHRVVVAA
jgi:hypothetical protein